MRGTTDPQTTMLSTLTADSMIPPDHPANQKGGRDRLGRPRPEFDAMYAVTGVGGGIE